jgi:hypothetical protein
LRLSFGPDSAEYPSIPPRRCRRVAERAGDIGALRLLGEWLSGARYAGAPNVASLARVRANFGEFAKAGCKQRYDRRPLGDVVAAVIGLSPKSLTPITKRECRLPRWARIELCVNWCAYATVDASRTTTLIMRVIVLTIAAHTSDVVAIGAVLFAFTAKPLTASHFLRNAVRRLSVSICGAPHLLGHRDILTPSRTRTAGFFR